MLPQTETATEPMVRVVSQGATSLQPVDLACEFAMTAFGILFPVIKPLQRCDQANVCRLRRSPERTACTQIRQHLGLLPARRTLNGINQRLASTFLDTVRCKDCQPLKRALASLCVAPRASVDGFRSSIVYRSVRLKEPRLARGNDGGSRDIVA